MMRKVRSHAPAPGGCASSEMTTPGSNTEKTLPKHCEPCAQHLGRQHAGKSRGQGKCNLLKMQSLECTLCVFSVQDPFMEEGRLHVHASCVQECPLSFMASFSKCMHRSVRAPWACSCLLILSKCYGTALQVHHSPLSSHQSSLSMDLLPPVTSRALPAQRRQRAVSPIQGTDGAEAAPSPGGPSPAPPGTRCGWKQTAGAAAFCWCASGCHLQAICPNKDHCGAA